MSIKTRIVAILLRLYPAAWRSEYGPELADVLLRRPLSLRTGGDVLWSAARQRVTAAEPSTLLGVAAMPVILAGLIWNIPALLQETSKLLPRVIVAPFITEPFVLLLIGCGCWTQLRHDGTLCRAGVSAMKLVFIAGIPVMIAGLLMFAGIFTYYSSQHPPLSPAAVLVSPLFRMPEAWIWGVVGGQIARRISRFRRQEKARS